MAPVPKHVEDKLARLTDRERQVLCSLASGKATPIQTAPPTKAAWVHLDGSG